MSALLDELKETISGCSRCGFCMVRCPSYNATKYEWDAARGRIRLAKDLVEGNRIIDQELKDPIDTCLMCRSCYENCPSGVDTPKAIQLMRIIRYREGKMKPPYRLLFEKVFTHPNLMSFGTSMMSSAQNIGLDKWGLGVAARMIPEAGAVARIIPQLPAKSARKQLPVFNAAVGTKRGKVLYFLGCATNLAYPDAAKSLVKFMQSQGVEVTIPNVSCCGLPAYMYGHIDVAQKLAARNIAAMDVSNYDAVISDCPTCLAFLQEYPDLFAEGESNEKAQALSAKVKDVPEYILNLGLLEPKHEFNKTITYHQPCHTGRYLKTGSQNEQLIKSLPGIQFIPAENQNDCCGGAGSYCVTQPDRSQKILTRKLQGIAKTNADILVTNCPACIIQLRSGINNSEDPQVKKIQVLNLMNLLASVYA
ncbi:MAG TPA: (Fe-S)-binding protein [Syntrophomonas sp.]|nr:(Fe-S)-binding protein [Syntrophomonas sp.]